MPKQKSKRVAPGNESDAQIALLQRAQDHRLCGEYRQAEPLLHQAWQQAEATRGRQNPLTAVVLNELGVLYKYMARFAEAGRAYRRALRIVQRAPADDPHEEGTLCCLASLYHNLGGLEHARGRYAQGEPHARRSVALRIQALGEGHLDVAADQAALAALLDGQGKFEEAEALYQQALVVFEQHYGPKHYEVAVTLNNLAAVYQLTGRGSEAEPLYRRALAIKEKLLGRKHPDVAMTVHNLAVLAAEQGHYTEAKRLYQRALAIFRKTFHQGHPKLVAAEKNFARLQPTGQRG